MGKRRNTEDMDEEKILKKIRKLEDKLKKKKDQESTEDRSKRPSIPDEFALPEDCESIYMPPSDWAGTTTPEPRPDLSPPLISAEVESELESEVEVEPEPTPTPRPRPPPAVNLSPQPGPSVAPAPATSKGDEDLDEVILHILGDAPQPETIFGSNIHKDIAARWQEILAKGLPKETKEKLVKEYLVPANCELLVPPILNPEAKAALSEGLVKRDGSLLAKQKYIAAAVAALAQVTQMLVSNDFSKEKLLKPVSDASRLLCDSHNLETKTRRSFVISSINSSLKNALIDTSRDKYLFGENLTEKLNAAKSIQKSGGSLKNKTQINKNIFNNKDKIMGFKNRLNSKALHPKTAGRFDAGPARPAASRVQPASRMQPPQQRRPRSPPPQPPRGQYTRR